MPRFRLVAFSAALLVLATSAVAECRFTLNFNFASAQLSLADTLLLVDLARLYPAGPFELSAHADDDGAPAANARISRARAAAVTARLRHGGAQPGAVMQALALGAGWDAVPSRVSSSLNRRVELFVGGCDPRRHPEARRIKAPGVAFTPGGRVTLTSPLLP